MSNFSYYLEKREENKFEWSTWGKEDEKWWLRFENMDWEGEVGPFDGIHYEKHYLVD